MSASLRPSKAKSPSFRFPLPTSSLTSDATSPPTEAAALSPSKRATRGKKLQAAAKGDTQDMEKIRERFSLLCKERKTRIENGNSVQKADTEIIKPKKQILSSSLETGIDDTDVYVESNPGSTSLASLREKTGDLLLGDAKRQSELQSLAPGASEHVIRPHLGRKALKKQRKAARESTKGDGWYGMKAPELTEETERDLEILQMRNALDPKRFYKKNDLKALPKFFQVGKVVDSPADFYSDRVPKKERGKTLVDELMADAEFKKFSKRKYAEIIEEKSKTQRRYQAKKGGKKRKAE